MTHVLVTFLGAPDTGKAPSLHSRSGYPEIGYKFAGDKIYRERLFPLALLKHLKDEATPANKMVVFGTAGSAWHLLPLYVLGCWPDKGELDRLARRSADGKVDEKDLEPFQNHQGLKDILNLQGLDLRLMGYAKTETEQVDVIAKLFDAARDATSVTFDVTHGLRYLPLLGSLAAYVMQASKKVPVKVWYGAYDMRKADALGEDIAPAMELGGLSRIVDWLAAFQNFEWDGDYSGFALLLEQDGIEKDIAGLLHEAAYAENLGDFEQATAHLIQFGTALSGRTVGGLTGLFGNQMLDHLQRFANEDLYQRQRRMAFESLAREDLPRVALFASEAAITRVAIQMRGRDQCKRGGKRNDAESEYKGKYKNIKQNLSDDDHQKKQRESFDRLLLIRNSFAHVYSEQPPPQVIKALSTKNACMDLLTNDIEEFLKENPEDPKLL
ncbi:conserved hypothetical protein [Candidatus Defluviicoccus seviourii]|uniref:CRISPR-associated protein, TM1812 family n=2 Tax=root TaxID=1 RepID=A0A564WHG2_9PROT|nr:conserved hypothetical protein [uncultured Defluviicoccus sp.]VUX47003.1 conserved hypothetical protein [Candidatus Defluviicoccus seviourii]